MFHSQCGVISFNAVGPKRLGHTFASSSEVNLPKITETCGARVVDKRCDGGIVRRCGTSGTSGTSGKCRGSGAEEFAQHAGHGPRPGAGSSNPEAFMKNKSHCPFRLNPEGHIESLKCSEMAIGAVSVTDGTSGFCVLCFGLTCEERTSESHDCSQSTACGHEELAYVYRAVTCTVMFLWTKPSDSILIASS